MNYVENDIYEQMVLVTHKAVYGIWAKAFPDQMGIQKLIKPLMTHSATVYEEAFERLTDILYDVIVYQFDPKE